MENILFLEVFVFVVSVIGGTIGSMIGLGGAIIITPALVTFTNIPIHYAIGASLVATICTSTATSIVSLKSHGLTKEKLGLFLAIGTAIGAIFGANLALSMSAKPLYIVFGSVLLVVLILSFRKRSDEVSTKVHPMAEKLQLNDSYTIKNKSYNYNIEHPIWGFISMLGAGFIGGLLGIGAGLFKVIAMDKIMKVPFKVSASTSNFIMGITGFAAAITYYTSNSIDPTITASVALGALLGATIGSKVMPLLSPSVLRTMFFIVVLLATIQMISKGF
ncbi:sulfite exporter TauE/SafE family protein [Francisella sp. Scap27]|uniref:sulfite exporter TauE/SafE family protein n=1 Tax=Francisella sp. Scap27 TaxID=2589986 RepID=UPI0015C14DF0|nr:sulfite exporter TauE/SafE family protein [Francisella sp. Scap27]QLE78256.1 sulfite exporter TauE/SafE family protein [Francisella sp. Scap27]